MIIGVPKEIKDNENRVAIAFTFRKMPDLTAGLKMRSMSKSEAK